MWWFVLIAGAAFALIPNMLDPFTGVNGSVLLGIILLSIAGFKLGGKK